MPWRRSNASEGTESEGRPPGGAGRSGPGQRRGRRGRKGRSRTLVISNNGERKAAPLGTQGGRQRPAETGNDVQGEVKTRCRRAGGVSRLEAAAGDRWPGSKARRSDACHARPRLGGGLAWHARAKKQRTARDGMGCGWLHSPFSCQRGNQREFAQRAHRRPR